MDVIKKIDEIMSKQRLTDYQLAKISGLSTSTISNMRKRNTVPSVVTLEYICDGLGITLSQFFVNQETQMYPVTDVQRDFLDYYILLSEEQQKLMLEIAKQMRSEKSGK